MEQKNESKCLEEGLLKYRPAQNEKQLISVYHATDDDEDGSLCAGAYVVKKEFIDTLIMARKNPGQTYEIHDAEPGAELIVSGKKPVEISYQEKEDIYQISAQTGRPDHSIMWHCTLAEIIKLYLTRDEEVNAILKHNQRVRERFIFEYNQRVKERLS